MRCDCCGKILNTQEATRRFKASNTFVDMCNSCLSTIEDDVEVTDGNSDDFEGSINEEKENDN